MNSVERKQAILGLLTQKEKVDVDELASLFGVSKVTVRADLDSLGEKGLLVRTHGGAMAPENQNLIRIFSNTTKENTEEKDRIAREASKLIKDGDSLIIDSGSTTLHLTKYLSGRNLTVATGSLLALNEMMNDETIELIVLGGTLRRYSMGAIGPMMRFCLEQMRVDWLFLGASAVSVETGISSSNLVEAETKKLMIESADKVCLMADSRKFSSRAFGRICSWDRIDYFITDAISDEDRAAIEAFGVKVVEAR